MTNRQAEIAELRRKIAERQQRIAELDRKLAGYRYAEWREKLMAWAEDPNANLAEMPPFPKGLHPIAELTDEERAAREKLIDEALEAAKKYREA